MPRILLERADVDGVPLRAQLMAEGSTSHFQELGERLLGLRNIPPSVKAAVGLAKLRAVDHALIAAPGDLVDYGAALTALEPDLNCHRLPIYPSDSARTDAGVTELLGALTGGGGGQTLDLALMARTLEMLSQKQLAGAFASAEWRRYLLGVVVGDGGQLPVAGELSSRARVALMGGLAGPTDLPDMIEAFGGRVVYEEWLQLAAELTLATNPGEALCQSPLVTGLRAREERLLAMEPHLDAVVLVVEPFCASALEEAWLRSACTLPLLVLEADGPAHLDATRVMRLENFARMAFGDATRRPS